MFCAKQQELGHLRGNVVPESEETDLLCVFWSWNIEESCIMRNACSGRGDHVP